MSDVAAPTSTRSSAAPRIAVIGTESSGKSVLITTLAKEFSQVSSQGILLNPLNNDTIRYVERNWQTLCSGDWPAGTPVGQHFELHWRLECNGATPIQCDVRIVDAAGQDLRRLFSEDKPEEIAKLPGPLRQLYAYCQSADIVICLVNLKDFLGECDPERRLDNMIVIKSALQRLAADQGRRLYLLFTQVDQYQGILKEHGGDWNRVLAQVLPYVHSVHKTKGQVGLNGVAAVNGTRVSIGPDGRPQRVPIPGFKSYGLEKLMEWIVAEARAIVTARQAAQQQREAEEARQENARRLQKQQQEEQDALLGAIILGGIALLIVLLWWWMRSPAEKPIAVQQCGVFYPSQIAARIRDRSSSDDIIARNDSTSTVRDLDLIVDIRRSNGVVQSVPLARVPELSPGKEFFWPGAISASGNDTVTIRVKWYDN